MTYATTDALFTGICDEIRAKDGSTELIRHQDIPARISAINSGGNGAGIDDIMIGEYFKVVNGIATGFDSIASIHTPLDFTPGDKTWEIQIKFKPKRNPAYENFYQALFGSHKSHFNCPAVQINLDRNTIFAGFRVKNGEDGWNRSDEQPYTFDTEIYHWVKFIYDGASYRVYISTDGRSFDEIIKIEYGGVVYQIDSSIEIGGLYENNTNWKFYGSIDLKEMYIKIGDEIWWGKGAKA